MVSNRKRVYESGARKRSEKKRKIESAAANTKPLSLFFQKSEDKDLAISSLPPQGGGERPKKMSRTLSLMKLLNLLTRMTKMCVKLLLKYHHVSLIFVSLI